MKEYNCADRFKDLPNNIVLDHVVQLNTDKEVTFTVPFNENSSPEWCSTNERSVGHFMGPDLDTTQTSLDFETKGITAFSWI